MTDDGSSAHNSVIYYGSASNGKTTSSILIGGHLYSITELENILGTSVGGDALINLGHQLIAAILNVVNGAGTPTALSLITQASDVLSTNNLVIGVNTVTNKTNKTLYNTLVTLAGNLDTYNSSGI